jgi:hypothetical protein
MNISSVSAPSFLNRLARNGTVLLLVVMLLVALVGVSGVLLFTSLDGMGRAQQAADAAATSTSELTKLGQLSQIATTGWMSESGVTDEVRSMLDKMLQGQCCALDESFAVQSLQWLDHAQVVLSTEKQQAAALIFDSVANKQLQADILKAYTAHEGVARHAGEIIADWTGKFGEARTERIRTAESDRQASVALYTTVQARLSQAISSARQQQDGLGIRQQDLRADALRLQQQSYWAIGGLVLGAVLFVAFLFVMYRVRSRGSTSSAQSVAPVRSNPTQKVRPARRKQGRRAS